jgi:CBS domain-containing protein
MSDPIDQPQAPDERERVERFEAAYNRIDHALESLVERRGGGRRHTFAARVRIAAHKLRRLRQHVDFLLEIGDLRNALIHSRTDRDVYLAVPNLKTVEQMEAIERDLVAPERVTPRFRREVISLRADQSLADALAYVRADGYSRYPVYHGRTFAGLLTSNGIARWCAAAAANGRLSIDAAAVKIADVLAIDHRRHAVAFVSADTAFADVAGMFEDDARLEAVLITENGRDHERPIGMICAPDLVGGEG